jgi:hypothetical protein
MSPRLSLAAWAGLFILAAVPGAVFAQGAPRACFYAHEISSWREAGDRTVNLRIGVRDVYQLTLLNSCPDLPFAEAIGIETARGASQHICTGLDVNIIVPSNVTHSVPQRCMATDLRKLSPEEAKALPPKQRP